MESAVEQQFAQYLSGLGFPPSSIVYQPTFQPLGSGPVYRPDFALIDPRTSERLAIIETKGRIDPETLFRAIQKVQQYVTALREKGVRGFVATPAESGGGFDFYTLGEDGKPKQVPSSSFLQFESLSSARTAEKKEMLEEKKDETTDQFVKVCRCAAAIAVLVAIADCVCSRYGITLLTTERMTLLGVAIALVVIPYVQKIKGLGVEIDRGSKKANG
ncbi:MAG: hypothetical protein ABSE73_13610 [Planctomycetota bacterium]